MQRVFEGTLEIVAFHRWVMKMDKRPADCVETMMPIQIRLFTDPKNQVLPKGRVKITVDIED